MTIDSAIQFTSRTIVVLGASVLLGWHVGALWIVQLHAAFPPMQYNAAVCFLLAGLAAMCACTRPRLAGTLGLAVAAIGLVTVMQYALGRSLGIDELLLRSYVTVETSHPGRMAPQTAIGFLLAGSALVLLTFARSLPHARMLAEILSSLLGGLGVAVAIGYGAGIESAYGWIDATRVALHTAFGFAVLALAILLNSWRLYAAEKSERPILAIPVAVGALAVTLALFQALLTWQDERVEAAAARDAERATAALEERLHGYTEKFGALAASWSRGGVGPRSSWEADVARFLRDQPEFLAISHIDADGTLNWIFPSMPYPDHVGFDYSRDDRRAYWLAAARERGGPLLTEPLALKTGRPGVLLVAPLAGGIGEPASSIVAAALLHDLFRPSALGMPAHRLTVFAGERVIYGSETDADVHTIRGRDLAIDGLALRLAVTPLAETLASWRSALPAVVLASGLLASLLLAATAHLAQVSSHRATDLSAANARLKVAKDKLERLALFDDLTGLGNRNLLVMELDKRLDDARRNNASLPLLLIDLNGFKAINDTFGHQAGDDVLREFAARLKDALPFSYEAFRTGGDEFAVLATPGTSVEESLAAARAIARLTETPFVIAGEPCVVHASIGVAAYPRHGEERIRLLRAADAAMYSAKLSATAIELARDDSPTAVMRALKSSRGDRR